MAASRSKLHRTPSARAFTTAASLALGLFAASHAHADTGVSAEPDVRFTGPLATGGPPLPKGLANVEPYLINTQVHGFYDEHGNRHHADGVPDGWALVVPVGYGLTERVGVGATFSAVDASTPSGGRTWELGDTGVSASYLLASSDRNNSSLTAAIKQNLTTGESDQLGRHGLAEATGSGAPTTQLSLGGQAYFLADRNLRGRFNVGWRLPGAHASLDGDSAYGTPNGFRGRAELHAASQASIGLEYSFNPEWVVATDVISRTGPRCTRARHGYLLGGRALRVRHRTAVVMAPVGRTCRGIQLHRSHRPHRRRAGLAGWSQRGGDLRPAGGRQHGVLMTPAPSRHRGARAPCKVVPTVTSRACRCFPAWVMVARPPRPYAPSPA